MVESKLFAGEPEKVARAFNRWSGDGVPRQIISILPLHVTEGVGFMIIFNTPEPAPIGKIVPVAGSIVH